MKIKSLVENLSYRQAELEIINNIEEGKVENVILDLNPMHIVKYIDFLTRLAYNYDKNDFIGGSLIRNIANSVIKDKTSDVQTNAVAVCNNYVKLANAYNTMAYTSMSEALLQYSPIGGDLKEFIANSVNKYDIKLAAIFNINAVCISVTNVLSGICQRILNGNLDDSSQCEEVFNYIDEAYKDIIGSVNAYKSVVLYSNSGVSKTTDPSPVVKDETDMLSIIAGKFNEEVIEILTKNVIIKNICKNKHVLTFKELKSYVINERVNPKNIDIVYVYTLLCALTINEVLADHNFNL